ncbi:MAG: hypothetical protein ACLQVG_10025 [Terriglobia bacterium]
MTATLTESEEEAPTPLTAAEAFKITAARETTLARMCWRAWAAWFGILPCSLAPTTNEVTWRKANGKFVPNAREHTGRRVTILKADVLRKAVFNRRHGRLGNSRKLDHRQHVSAIRPNGIGFLG